MSSSVITTTDYITDQSVIGSYNRGPITTAFHPPAECSTILTRLPSGSTDLFFGNWGGELNTLCYPTGSRLPSDLVTGDWGSYYYSPAICPLGWTTVTTFDSFVPGWNTWEFVALNTETTAALCCPSGYSYFQKGHQCSSTITKDETVVFFQPTKDGESWSYGTPTTTSFFYATSVVGDGVPIWWQSSDAKVLASASTMTTNGATAGTIPNLSTASPTSNPSDSSGLTTGAKIGIGVGIPVAVIAGLAIGLLFGLKRRRDRKANASGAERKGWVAEDKEMPVASVYPTGQTQELDGDARYELDDVDRAQELGGEAKYELHDVNGGSRHELHDIDGSSRYELSGVAHR